MYKTSESYIKFVFNSSKKIGCYGRVNRVEETEECLGQAIHTSSCLEEINIVKSYTPISSDY